MIDREETARFPLHDFRLRQSSSYNRASVSPDDYEGWFDNFDRSTKPEHGNFLRVEQNGDRTEYVVMDHEGAGALVRVWMPWRSATKHTYPNVLRVYLDGSDEPVIEGDALEVFDGSGLFEAPFAHPSIRSAVSFFPIPYAKRMKITMSEVPFFFQFTYRDYDDDTPVKTFTMADFESATAQADKVGDKLMTPRTEGVIATMEERRVLANGEAINLELPPGPASVRDVSVVLDGVEDPSMTRRLVLKAEFDNKETVWTPIGEFFGTGVGVNPFQGFYREVREDGSMVSRWVMPYQDSGTISLVNLCECSADVELKVTTGTWEWDERSLYFHAGYKQQYPVPTRPHTDWNYIKASGRGVYVGDTLTVMNPVARWWGEGDEKIWVDGEEFPSIFGTGTEDYYAYSWGGLSTDFYEHPFHAQVRSHKYNRLNRKPPELAEVKNASGLSTETRSRALDTIPFASSLQLDMEVWHWLEDVDMAYSVGAYWYGDLETHSSLKPAPNEVVDVPPVIVVD